MLHAWDTLSEMKDAEIAPHQCFTQGCRQVAKVLLFKLCGSILQGITLDGASQLQLPKLAQSGPPVRFEKALSLSTKLARVDEIPSYFTLFQFNSDSTKAEQESFKCCKLLAMSSHNTKKYQMLQNELITNTNTNDAAAAASDDDTIMTQNREPLILSSSKISTSLPHNLCFEKVNPPIYNSG